MYADRRHAKRTGALVVLQADAAFASGEELALLAHNVSTSGAFCTVPRDIPLFTRLALRLEIPGGGASGATPTEVLCQGVVVRHEEVALPEGGQEHSIAVLFEHISPRARAALEAFVGQP
jgi:hypothetical protein